MACADFLLQLVVQGGIDCHYFICLPSVAHASENMIELFKFNLPAETTEEVDLVALARLLRKSITADAQWDGARKRARTIISSINKEIDDQKN